MIDFPFYVSFLNFLLLELHRQLDIPLTGDYKECNKYLHTNLTIHF